MKQHNNSFQFKYKHNKKMKVRRRRNRYQTTKKKLQSILRWLKKEIKSSIYIDTSRSLALVEAKARLESIVK